MRLPCAMIAIVHTHTHTQTVRLIDGSSYELLRVVDTKDIHGWHTLTYLAFDPSEVSDDNNLKSPSSDIT